MDPLDSYVITLRNLLGAALREHRCSRQWHYAIDMEDTHQDSLASYLRLSHQDLRSLLVTSGLASLHGKQFRIHKSMGHSTYSWETFLVEQSLDGYFDSMIVNKTRHCWIGLGSIKKKLPGPFNPATQSRYFKTPPRLPQLNHAALRKSRSMMLAVLSLHNEEIEKNKQPDDDDEDDNLEGNKGKDLEDLDENLRNSALVLLEQISKKDTSIDPVEAIEALMKTIRESQNAKQKVRLSLVLGGGEEDDGMEEEEFETRQSSFPVLSLVGLPVTKRLVSSLLREIVALSFLHPQHGLLSYETHRGTSCELVKVTRSKNKECFVTNVRRHHSWLHRLPSLVVAETVEPSIGASWILQHLALNFEDEFVHVCKKMGYPVFSKKMEAATACAMWQEANVSKKSQRTILRYLAAEFGGRLVVPEVQVDAFGQDHVPPVPGTFEDAVTGKTIHFWTKPIAKLLEVAVTTHAKEKGITTDEAALARLKSIDVVLGGDHGQGKFRSVIKIILRDNEGKMVDTMVMKVGHIDCQKDTYEVLRSSVAGPLNQSMQEVFDSGALQLVQDEDGSVTFRMKAAEGAEQSLTILSSLPIRVFVTGDLAYLAAILGKVNMSGGWCTWCGLSPKEWSPTGHEKGANWTLQAMAEVRTAIETGVLPDTSANRQGCVDEPLRTCVPIESYILPILHTEIGIGNRLITSFLDWVDLRIEKVPDNEMEERYGVYEAQVEVQIHNEIWDDWVNLKGGDLADLREERAMINYNKGLRDDDLKLVHNAAERKEMEAASKARTVEVKALEKEKKEIGAQLETFKKVFAQRTKALNKLRKKRHRMDSPVKNGLEKLLAILGIDRAAYHGGDLNGKNVQQMFQESDDIFSKFKELLLQVDVEEGRCSDEEIADMIRRYSEVCTLFDYLFSMARTPTGELTEAILEETKRCLRVTMVKWRDLRLSMKLPKIHGLEDHLIAMMEQWNGIGDFLEDFIEQAHQFGMKEEKRTANMRDRVRAAISHSKWEWADKMSSDVRIAKEEVMKKSSRKRKAGNEQPLRERKEIVKRQKRMETRRACLNAATLEPNPIEDLLVRNTMEYMDIATSTY
jgi:hypothetical protein